MRGRLGLVALVTAALLSLSAPAAHAARGLSIGLTDDGVFESSDGGTRATWLDRARQGRTDQVILGANWASIAPASRPPLFNPRNPADPNYSWGSLDDAVRDAKARGLKVVILVGRAPRWAEGKHRPRSAPEGTWKPSPKKLAAFGHAIAERYSGHFLNLPRVRYFQLWGEVNLDQYLSPQWKHGHPYAPKRYRKMLNAFYGAVHGVRKSDKVVTGGTAPYGDPPGGPRMPPVTFWRSVLCLKGSHLRPARCRHPAHFDVFAHNPINVGGPTTHARNHLDVSTPDIGRLRRILRKAERTHRARGARHHPIWATEIWWDSKPPDPHGVPQRKQARYLEQAFYVLWRQRVKSVFWFLIRDQAPNPSFASTYQTGLFTRGGSAKPAFTAYRFPFVASRKGKRRARVWGEAPQGGRVVIQRRRHKGWHTIKRAHAGKNRVFVGRVHVRGRAKLRAAQGHQHSLAWPLH